MKAFEFPFRAGQFNEKWQTAGTFGEQRKAGKHGGIDVGAPPGTPVRAIGKGIVRKVRFNHASAGTYIDVEHTGAHRGYWSRYLHLRKVRKKEGQRVRSGQVIGLSGGVPNEYGSGHSYSPHLHLELWKGIPFGGGSERLNPAAFMRSPKKQKVNPVLIGGAIGLTLVVGVLLLDFD